MLALTLAAGAGAAHAQLRLPSINLPGAASIGGLDLERPGPRGAALVDARALPDLRALRLDQVGQLLRAHRDVLEADPRGEPIVRREILAWAPSPAALAAALAAGLRLEREVGGDAPELRMLVLRAPDGADTAAVLAKLRALDPDGVYDFNHLYMGGAAAPMAGPAAMAGTAPMAGPAPMAGLASMAELASMAGLAPMTGPVAMAGLAPMTGPAPMAGPAPMTELAPRVRGGGGGGDARAAGGGPRVGLVDSGVDSTHAVFRDARIERWGCAGQAHPSAHGTAVAALMVGQSGRFRGAAPQAKLYAADIYCDSATGGSADKIAAALAWLDAEQVAVINISLVGPANQTLERMVAALQQRGHLLVAAVGNDGPAAPPLYPASYPGVVGVSAVDRNGRALPEAARGPQVMFAAPGNNMVSAAPGTPPYRAVRGTSFAAPLVAALLAASITRPDKAQCAAAVAALARQAAHGDGATVSNATGYGIVGAALRTDPSSLR